eukprot:364991-Chlamydomonas_euryale.AAC.7
MDLVVGPEGPVLEEPVWGRSGNLVWNGRRTSPNRYNCSPQAPTAFMTDALWMTLTGMPRWRARSWMSVCVVALHARDGSEQSGGRGGASSARWATPNVVRRHTTSH